MQPNQLLRTDGEIRIEKGENERWHTGTLFFFRKPDSAFLVEVYHRVDERYPAFSRTFTPGQLKKIPPRTMSPRYCVHFMLDNLIIKIKTSSAMLSNIVDLLNNIKETQFSEDHSPRPNYFRGAQPYMSYGQKQVAASKRHNYSPRHSPVIKSPSGQRLIQSPKRFRPHLDYNDSDSYSLEVIHEDSNPHGFTPQSFFRSSNNRNYGEPRTPFKSHNMHNLNKSSPGRQLSQSPNKYWNHQRNNSDLDSSSRRYSNQNSFRGSNNSFGENRSPLKSINMNYNQNHSKRPKQLDFDSSKHPKLSYDNNFIKESGQLGGQAKSKDFHNQKPCELPDITSNSPSGESSPYEGFPNIGNSCFMNSVLQSLMQLQCIAQDMEQVRQSLEKSLPEQSIIRYLLLLLSCPTEERQMLLGQTLEVVCNSSPCFADGQQHDALEFLVQLLDVIKEEVKKASKGTAADPVTNNIEFKLHSSYICQNCQKGINKKEVLHMLSLNVPKAESGEISCLTDAIKDYFEPQDIEMKCEHCSGSSTKCFQGFSTLPRVLIFHLKRYTYVEGTCKILCPVQVPIHLSLENYIVDDASSNEVEKSIPLSSVSTMVHNPDKSSAAEKNVLTSPKTPRRINSLKGSFPERKPLSTLHTSNPNVPVALKGGSDSVSISSPVPTIGSDVPVENVDENVMETIAEETEDEQYEKILKMSIDSAQSQEDKELIEAMNRSVQDTCMASDDLDENELSQDDFSLSIKENDDTENISSPLSYQLASVVSHIGHNADTGHYVANLFEPHSGQWWHFNDEVVHRKSKHAVLESIKTQGYLFFYVARNSLQE